MSVLDNIEAPHKFKYRDGQVQFHLHYTFKCNNRVFFSKTSHKDLIDHEYKLRVDVNSTINDRGLGSDFMDIDKMYKEKIAVYLDGQILNETLTNMNTTAENIAYWILDQFSEHLEAEDEVVSVTLYESPKHGLTVYK